MSTHKQNLLSSIASYYHAHPYDTKASSFFQAISSIDNEDTLRLLRSRMQKALHRIQVTRLTTRQHNIATVQQQAQQHDTAEAEALIATLA